MASKDGPKSFARRDNLRTIEAEVRFNIIIAFDPWPAAAHALTCRGSSFPNTGAFISYAA